MKKTPFYFLLTLIPLFLQSQTTKSIQLVETLTKTTPILEDLHELCDQIGGRVTGTPPNEKAVEWAIQKLEKAGVKTWKETFEMPRRWAEKSAKATITGDVTFTPKIACRAFSTGSPKDGLTAEMIFIGKGATDEFEEKKEAVKDKFVLIQTPLMEDLGGLFLEYINAVEIESNAKKYGAKGVVYMSSRAKKLLYRHLTSYGAKNEMPMVVMARDDATRCKRLLKRGKKLNLTMNLEVVDEGAYQSHNVLAEIKGSVYPDEVILIGAHLDSWGLGTGANDNGCNVTMMIDIARQITALGLQPQRTIRFALWNGEEQGMFGSWAYNQQHLDELDQIKVTMSIDIGSGNIDGFFMNGRNEFTPYLEKYLKPLAPLLGPFTHIPDPIIGTDNYDFLVQGVPNLVGKHDVYNYCEDYHSESDTYDKVSEYNLKNNAAIVASVTWGFANEEKLDFKRYNREEVQKIIEEFKLEGGMKALCLWNDWINGKRGIQK